MRLYPPAYAVGREAVRDCEVGGYRIPAGMQVFAFQWAVHRDARWYEEPAAFRPERWRDEVAARLPKFAYFPFGGGPRQCIGNSFAMMEAVLGHAVELLPAMSLRPRDGVRVTLERR